jgi:hypothetical protein
LEEVLMRLTTGRTLANVVDAATLVVVRAPAVQLKLTCGGVETADAKAGAVTGQADLAQQYGMRLGKRYAMDGIGLELLCTRADMGASTPDGTPVPVKDTKPLPVSD